MTDTIRTVRPDDIAPDSPYRLAPSTQFIVGEPTANGIRIRSQHREVGAAQGECRTLRRLLRGRSQCEVYSITREQEATQ